ncbi:hypothetical protein IJ472_05590 [bacterium]|nr:hypothetical protein [bacterium]
MLVLFFTIIFLAELIVAGWVISKIMSARKYVCELNQQVTDIQPVIKENIDKTHEGLTKTLNSLRTFINFLAEKKGQCSNLMKRNILSTTVAVILKLPFKEILSALEVILKVKKILGK